MNWILGALALAAIACFALRPRFRHTPNAAPTRDAGKGSIMDEAPERMSLFSADNVRLLSDAQIRAIERSEDPHE